MVLRLTAWTFGVSGLLYALYVISGGSLDRADKWASVFSLTVTVISVFVAGPSSANESAGGAVLFFVLSSVVILLVVGVLFSRSSVGAGGSSELGTASTNCPGARPAVTQTSTEPRRHAGVLTLLPGYSADLDSRCADWEVQAGPAAAGRDLELERSGMRSSRTDQIVTVAQGSAKTLQMCASNTSYVEEVRRAEIRKGRQFCVYTNAGRRSLLTVTNGGVTRGGVIFDVVTWEQRQPRKNWPLSVGWTVTLIAVALFWLVRNLLLPVSGEYYGGHDYEGDDNERSELAEEEYWHEVIDEEEDY